MKTLFFMVVCFWAVVLGQFLHQVVPVDNVNRVCVSRDPEVGTLKYGEVITAKKGCVKILCIPGHVVYEGCRPIWVEPPCYEGPENLNKPYPDCCPEPVCPEGFPKSK